MINERSPQKIGIVFSGGGGKGPYQVGVWRAMSEYGLDKDVVAVSGTSVGALNAALFAQGDLQKAESAWLSMSPDDILSFDIEEIITAVVKRGLLVPIALVDLVRAIALFGVFSRKGLERIINNYLDIDIINNRGLPYFACATKISSYSARYFSLKGLTLKELNNILLASSAIPAVFPYQKVNGSNYWDGFLKDNTPIKPLAEEGCNIIIAVMLSRSDLIPVDQFPDCKVIPIYPQDDPGWALNFNGIVEKMQRGYDDTVRILKPVFELVEINYQYSVELQKYKKQHSQYEQIVRDREQINRTLSTAKGHLKEEMSKW